MKHLIITSRCPISHERVDGKDVVKTNVGGVATALRRVLKTEGGIWVCWGDGKLDSEHEVEDFEGYKIVRVLLNPKEKKGFYDQYANGTLWPLFHYFRTRIKFTPDSYAFYKSANKKFRDQTLRFIEKDMDVWIHDYQLTLLPGMLKDSGINNHITFTWHIPWVSQEFFSILPESREIMRSMCKSDLVTFHTKLHRSNFLESANRLLGHEYKKRIRAVAIPLGIDPDYYHPNEARPLRIPNIGDRKIIFSIDRLDYTKGLTNRVMAIDTLMRKHRELRNKFVYIMIVTPSRTSLEEYKTMKRDLEMNVGRVDGKHGDLEWRPILYLYRKITDNLLRSLYSKADIAFITPLIDGLNLVSKEFVSANEKGILIISKFAGASIKLSGSLRVNPYDIQEMADALYEALNMRDDEIKERLNTMKHEVITHDIDWWVRSVMRAGEITDRKAYDELSQRSS